MWSVTEWTTFVVPLMVLQILNQATYNLDTLDLYLSAHWSKLHGHFLPTLTSLQLYLDWGHSGDLTAFYGRHCLIAVAIQWSLLLEKRMKISRNSLKPASLSMSIHLTSSYCYPIRRISHPHPIYKITIAVSITSYSRKCAGLLL